MTKQRLCIIDHNLADKTLFFKDCAPEQDIWGRGS